MLNKDEFKRMIASTNNISLVEAERAIEMILEGLKEAMVAQGGVRFLNFGSFGVKHKEACVKHNPQNPQEKIQVPAKVVPYFKPGKTLKVAVNE